MGKIIKSMEKDGYYVLNKNPYRVINAKKDGVYIYFEVELMTLWG